MISKLRRPAQTNVRAPNYRWASIGVVAAIIATGLSLIFAYVLSFQIRPSESKGDMIVLPEIRISPPLKRPEYATIWLFKQINGTLIDKVENSHFNRLQRMRENPVRFRARLVDPKTERKLMHLNGETIYASGPLEEILDIKTRYWSMHYDGYFGGTRALVEWETGKVLLIDTWVEG